MSIPRDNYKPAEKLELKEIKAVDSKLFQKVHCPACSSEVDAADLNLQHHVAKCSSCNVVFSIEDIVAGVKSKKEMRTEIFRPEGIDLFYYKDELDITVDQFVHGLDLFALIFMPILAFFSILIYFLGSNPIPIYIPGVFVLGTAYYIFKARNYAKNKTYITVIDQYLDIRSRPKNFKKDRKYTVDELDQLYLKQSADGTGNQEIWIISNTIEGQKHEKLITVNTISKAKYLEQEIEHYLGLENRMVPEATA